jgi:predicted phage baseplate assembly protein
MPLPTPTLDARHVQDIVEQVKSMIPRYCPEWTDHNVSDPGVTLIELFAWMTDMLLYRVNQVPDKSYIKFLELIGVRLESPRAARGPVTFYLSAAQPAEIAISAGAEGATVRTETNPAIVFSTEEDLVIRPPVLTGAYTRNSSHSDASAWTTHDLRQLGVAKNRIALFPPKPGPGDAFYLSFSTDLTRHVLALAMNCDSAGGAGIDPNNPPTEWEVWQGGLARWAPCEVEYDGTGGFNRMGEIILHAPQMALGDFQGQRAYWLRCQLTDAQVAGAGYVVSPSIYSLKIESRGGTVGAFLGVTIHNELLGTADGTPGQSFKLLHAPVLARNPETDYLVIEPPGGQPERWHEVGDFGDSASDDKNYTFDNLDGTITLGPSLLQPDGSVYRFGAVPTKGSALTFTRYQQGGGVEGNVPRGMLTVLKTSIPYVSSVINRAPAIGGRDTQRLDDAMLRAPHMLRTRSRAVTADDYEYLATQVNGVARARCLAPGSQPGDPSDPRPGQVFVIVLPQGEATVGRLDPDQLTLSAELRASVMSYLDDRRLLGTALEVRAPQYAWVSVHATHRLPDRSDAALAADVREQALAALYRYLNPYTGGPRGDGWPFGRDLYQSEIFSLLQAIPHVEFVEDARVFVTEGTGAPKPAAARLILPRHGIICSDTHEVRVS